MTETLEQETRITHRIVELEREADRHLEEGRRYRAANRGGMAIESYRKAGECSRKAGELRR